jgi:phosphoglycolate phosphatase
MEQIFKHLEGKKHIIWDWNGTILDDVDVSIEAIAKVLEEKGIPVISKERYRKIFGFPISHYYKRLGLSDCEIEHKTVSMKFHENYDLAFDKCKLHDGFLDIYHETKSRGLKHSILSAAQQEWLLGKLEYFGIKEFFDHIYGLKDYTALSKVDRGRELLKVSGFSANESILIGDTDHDVEVGKEIGIDVVIYADGHQHPDKIKGFGVPVLNRTKLFQSI